MNIQVAIPTYKKNKAEIIDLYHFLNLKSDALFCVQQSSKEYDESIIIDGHTISIHYSTSIGVSKNRNDLMKYASGDIVINTDDDCPLVDNYIELVLDSYNKHKDSEAIYFNGLWVTHNNKRVTNKRSGYISHFYDISFAGGPGLTYIRDRLNKYNLKYDESIGYPNEIEAGEDSCFYYDMVHRGVRFYRDSRVLFKVEIDESNSTYNKGINKDYCITRGYITKRLHPRLYRLYLLKHLYIFSKSSKDLSKKDIYIYLLEGSKRYKK